MLSWSGSSRWVSGSGSALAPECARRWLPGLDECVEVKGLPAAALGVGATEVVTGAAEVWLTLALGAEAVTALLALDRGVRAGARVAT